MRSCTVRRSFEEPFAEFLTSSSSIVPQTAIAQVIDVVNISFAATQLELCT